MNKGYIRCYGKKAITIQTQNLDQYYAPYENVEELIIPFLDDSSKYPILVTFEIDRNNSEGYANGKKRYYANNVRIDDTIIL